MQGWIVCSLRAAQAAVSVVPNLQATPMLVLSLGKRQPLGWSDFSSSAGSSSQVACAAFQASVMHTDLLPWISCSLASESQQSVTSSTISEVSTPASQPATPMPTPRRVTLAQPLSVRPSASPDHEWAQPIVEEPPTSLTAPQYFAQPRQLQPTPQERFLKVLVVRHMSHTAISSMSGSTSAC